MGRSRNQARKKMEEDGDVEMGELDVAIPIRSVLESPNRGPSILQKIPN
jgi:hypothetical protein